MRERISKIISAKLNKFENINKFHKFRENVSNYPFFPLGFDQKREKNLIFKYFDFERKASRR